MAPSQQATYPPIISCFPQMKPEGISNIEQGMPKEEVGAPDQDISEEEQFVLDLLKDNSPMDLNELK